MNVHGGGESKFHRLYLSRPCCCVYRLPLSSFLAAAVQWILVVALFLLLLVLLSSLFFGIHINQAVLVTPSVDHGRYIVQGGASVDCFGAVWFDAIPADR